MTEKYNLKSSPILKFFVSLILFLLLQQLQRPILKLLAIQESVDASVWYSIAILLFWSLACILIAIPGLKKLKEKKLSLRLSADSILIAVISVFILALSMQLIIKSL